MSRVFLLSPASCSGGRAAVLTNPRAEFDLARRLREGGAPLGETFAFLSGLYFRGKLAYAQAFAAPPPGTPGVLVITSGGGLRRPEERITLATLRRFAGVPIDAGERRYLEPLLRDALRLADQAGPECEFVLLGSIASEKYREPLGAVFGTRLRFPPTFVGRGDMSRGGLLLRCVDAGQELEYAVVNGSERHGPRPPRLGPRFPRSDRPA
jgi:hypothetical protein